MTRCSAGLRITSSTCLLLSYDPTAAARVIAAPRLPASSRESLISSARSKRSVAAFRGRRVFVVEDGFLIASMMQEILKSLGCTVVGPAHGLGEALQLARLAEIDAALLDVKLKGTDSYPIAQSLQLRGIPFAFVTAFCVGVKMGAFRCRPPIREPFRPV